MRKAKPDLHLLTVEDVAAALGVHRATVWRYIDRGTLEAFQPGKRAYLITPAAFKAFQDKTTKP